MKVKDLIENKVFINEFVLFANQAFTFSGGYNDVYEQYEDQLSDEEILELLDYCEENNLLED